MNTKPTMPLLLCLALILAQLGFVTPAQAAGEIPAACRRCDCGQAMRCCSAQVPDRTGQTPATPGGAQKRASQPEMKPLPDAATASFLPADLLVSPSRVAPASPAGTAAVPLFRRNCSFLI